MIVLEANFGQSTKVYTYKLDVVNSDVPVAVGAISVAYNPTTMEDSSDGVYYYKNISVQVTDVDGKPIPNQDVTMGVNALAYYKGHLLLLTRLLLQMVSQMNIYQFLELLVRHQFKL